MSSVVAKILRFSFWSYGSSNNIGINESKAKQNKLECGQMPNVMVALPNTGGALCSTPQSFADAHYWSAVQ